MACIHQSPQFATEWLGQPEGAARGARRPVDSANGFASLTALSGEIAMHRLAIAASVFALAFIAPVAAQEIPPAAEQALLCGHVFSLKSGDDTAAGDQGAATEFYYRGDELIWRARLTLEEAGFDMEAVQGAVDSSAMMTGFRYGAGEADALLAECLAMEE